jgi:hypothetical protein
MGLFSANKVRRSAGCSKETQAIPSRPRIKRARCRRYLRAGVMVDGVRQPTPWGSPQGRPVSSLLANLLLDDLDQDLERRGHRFVRCVDDILIIVRSRRAAERVKASITRYLTGCACQLETVARVRRGPPPDSPGDQSQGSHLHGPQSQGSLASGEDAGDPDRDDERMAPTARTPVDP